jgi:hypothetical protein
MLTFTRGCVALLATLTAVILVRGDVQDKQTALDKKHLAEVREAASELIRDIEELQWQFIIELGQQKKERVLYRQADIVLGELLDFRTSLRPDVSLKQLYKTFDNMDRKLHALVAEVDKRAPKNRSLQRAAARVQIADEHLHYVLLRGDGSETRMSQLLASQAHSLLAAAQDLQQTFRYAPAMSPGKAVIEEALGKLAKTAAALHKDATAGADRKQLQREFADVTAAWQQATAQLKDLPPRQNVYLLRSAQRFDLVHERLHRLLGIKGERPGLIIRT